MYMRVFGRSGQAQGELPEGTCLVDGVTYEMFAESVFLQTLQPGFTHMRMETSTTGNPGQWNRTTVWIPYHWWYASLMGVENTIGHPDPQFEAWQRLLV